MQPGEMVLISAFEDEACQRPIATVTVRSYDLSADFDPLSPSLSPHDQEAVQQRARAEMVLRGALTREQADTANLVLERIV